MGDLGSIPGLGRSGEGKGYSLQYSGLENSMDTSEPLSLSLFYLAEGEKVSILSEIGQGFKKTNCGF